MADKVRNIHISDVVINNIIINADRHNMTADEYIRRAIEELEDDLFCEQLAEEAEEENDGEGTAIEDLAAELGIKL